VKPDSSPISSQVMLDRQADLLAGRVQPSTDTDRVWLAEMNEILEAGGSIAVPTDLPDPISSDEAARHLSLDDDDEPQTKRARPGRFDWYGRDGDLDGRVQDGTAFERRSRSNSHRTIGQRRRRRVQLRLRDLPFPFTPPATPNDKPPVVATPEEKSFARRFRPGRSWLGGRPSIRAARYDANAVDGDRDGKVQDGTSFERPAQPRVLPSKKPKRPPGPPKMYKVDNDPFRAKGRRDDVGSVKELTPQRIAVLKDLISRGDVFKISAFLSRYAPFGGHRSKSDGAHPALRDLVSRHAKIAEEKFGPLDTLEQMETALKKAFPNADVGLTTALDLGGEVSKVSADQSFRFTTPNFVAAIRQRAGIKHEEAREQLLRIQRAATKTWLAMAVDRPDIAETMSYVGFGLGNPKKDPNYGYITSDLRDDRKAMVVLDPAMIALGAAYEPSETAVLSADLKYANLLTGNVPQDKETLSSTSVGGLTWDSDLEALVTGTLIHEMGHLAGYVEVAKSLRTDIDNVAPFREIISGTQPIDTKQLTGGFRSLIEELVNYRQENRQQIERWGAELAKKHIDLEIRMRINGTAIPPNLAKMSEAERRPYAEAIIQNWFMAVYSSSLLSWYSKVTTTERTSANAALRTLGGYGLTEPEEAAAEMFLADRLGVPVGDIVDQSKDSLMHKRVARP
jgi:hypothetical protein